VIRPELVVFSHLRWDFVWQRPQHLISRIGRGHAVWFVEEPQVVPGLDAPRLRVEEAGRVRRVWLEVGGSPRHLGFGDPVAEDYPAALARLLGGHPRRTVWAYTPMALPLIDSIDRAMLVYDVMDDLASFAFAPAAMRLNEQRLLHNADIVFTGGRTIHAGVEHRARAPVHLFASGVETEHYATARQHRVARERPVAGYVGVIDERIDLEIVGGLAVALPDWDVHMVGPVMKVDPATLPDSPNLHYPGMQPYDRLPEVMAGFDVALMPFALNDATRAISPTKTLEYFAAGLPVVSTRIADVVADYAEVVAIADDADGFAAACEGARAGPDPSRDSKIRAILRMHQWDVIAHRMRALLDDARSSPGRVVRTADAVASTRVS